MLLFSKTEADGFKQHLSFLNACMSDTVKKFTLDPQVTLGEIKLSVLFIDGTQNG